MSTAWIVIARKNDSVLSTDTYLVVPPIEASKKLLSIGVWAADLLLPNSFMRYRLLCLLCCYAACSFVICVIATSASIAQPVGVPRPDHIVVVIYENHGYGEIIGSSAAPHINALAYGDHSALFTQSYGIEHPSQPNYLDLFAGCNQGITSDAVPTKIPFTTDNLARELIDAGKTFVTFSEDLPSVGYNGASSGNYARKHNPVANWMGTGTNQVPTTTNQPLSAFPAVYSTLPTVCYVVPNQNNDMHNGSAPANITTGDNWFNDHLMGYVEWAKTHNSLLILTFDEDDNSAGNKVVTIFAGEMVKPGHYDEQIDHYSILRTIEDIYGLRHACNAESATPITDCWTAASGVATSTTDPTHDELSLVPNPTNGIIHISGLPVDVQAITVTDVLGINVLTVTETNAATTALDLTGLASGTYYVRFDRRSGALTRAVVKR